MNELFLKMAHVARYFDNNGMHMEADGVMSDMARAAQHLYPELGQQDPDELNPEDLHKAHMFDVPEGPSDDQFRDMEFGYEDEMNKKHPYETMSPEEFQHMQEAYNNVDLPSELHRDGLK